VRDIFTVKILYSQRGCGPFLQFGQKIRRFGRRTAAMPSCCKPAKGVPALKPLDEL
jgi:hypothetical protein